jgi:hypothetical protein
MDDAIVLANRRETLNIRSTVRSKVMDLVGTEELVSLGFKDLKCAGNQGIDTIFKIAPLVE